MRVGIDYLPAVTHWPGVGRYARELVRALAPLEDRPELALLDVGGERRTIGEPWLGLAGARGVRRRSRRLPRRVLRVLARLGRGADRALGGVDVFHSVLPGWPPVSAARRTLAVGELPPEGSPEEERLAGVLRELAGALAASRHGAAELARRFSLPPERVFDVSLGCDHWRRDYGAEPPPKAGAPSLLVLGALRRERRHDTILSAFEDLLAGGHAARLVVLGGGARADRERFSRNLAFSSARGAVEWVPEPAERDLPRRVAEAWVLVHLSRGELTAVTPLEALSFGTAVVTNPGGAFEEALGEEACYFDAERRGRPDAPELARAIRTALEGAADPQGFRRRVERAAPFTWERSARATVAAWRAVAGAR